MKKTKTNYTTSIILLIISGTLSLMFYRYYQISENLLEKIFVAALFICGICPILFSIFITFLTSKLETAFKPKRSNKNNKIEHTTNRNTKVVIKQKPSKEVTTEGYSETRDLFKSSTQNSKLSMEDYYLIKQFIISKLGDNYNRYKEVNWQNDSHCIYSILKCSKLTKDDYDTIYNYIKGILEPKLVD